MCLDRGVGLESVRAGPLSVKLASFEGTQGLIAARGLQVDYKHQRSICDIYTTFVHGRGACHASASDLLGGNFSIATYTTYRMLTKALDRRTPYKMMYDVKSDLADLRVFGVLCAIVEKLKVCGLGYMDQWCACNICAMHVHRGIGLEQGGRKYLMYFWGGG